MLILENEYAKLLGVLAWPEMNSKATREEALAKLIEVGKKLGYDNPPPYNTTEFGEWIDENISRLRVQRKGTGRIHRKGS